MSFGASALEVTVSDPDIAFYPFVVADAEPVVPFSPVVVAYAEPEIPFSPVTVADVEPEIPVAAVENEASDDDTNEPLISVLISDESNETAPSFAIENIVVVLFLKFNAPDVIWTFD